MFQPKDKLCQLYHAVTRRCWDDLLFWSNGGYIVALCQYLGLLPLEKTIRPLRYLHIHTPFHPKQGHPVKVSNKGGVTEIGGVKILALPRLT